MKLEIKRRNMDYWAGISETIEQFIRDKVEEFNRGGAIIGLSGGIDSAIVAKLAVNSLGPDKLKVLLMPEKDSNRENMKDALALAKELEISNITRIGITGILRKLGTYRLFFPFGLLPRVIVRRLSDIKQRKLAEMGFENIFMEISRGAENVEISKARAYIGSKARVRMLVTYFHAELENLLVLGTSNKSELMLGYFIKYGDGGVDIAPIAPLYKTEIFDFARFLEIPEKIINKAPSADLAPGVTDEGSVGMTYERIDKILLGIEKGLDDQEISEYAQEDLKNVTYIRSLTIYSRHMRELSPSPDI